MPARATARRRHGAAVPRISRDSILGAAKRRFIRFGPHKTTMDEIAAEAGCSRATVYLHFSNKDDLYATLLERETDAFVREAETLLRSEHEFFKKFGGLCRLWIATYRNDPILQLALAHDPEMTIDPVARQATRAQARRIIDLMRQVLEEGVEKGIFRQINPERVAYLMTHLVGLLIERELSGQNEYPFRQIMRVVEDLTQFGICADPPRHK